MVQIPKPHPGKAFELSLEAGIDMGGFAFLIVPEELLMGAEMVVSGGDGSANWVPFQSMNRKTISESNMTSPFCKPV